MGDKKEDVKDDFFIEEDGEQYVLSLDENDDEKRNRLAKELLTKINKDIQEDNIEDEEEDEFIKNLKNNNQVEDEQILESVLKRRAMDIKGKLHHKVADKLDLPNCKTTFLKGHKKAITDFVFTKDESKIYSVSKDC